MLESSVLEAIRRLVRPQTGAAPSVSAFRQHQQPAERSEEAKRFRRIAEAANLPPDAVERRCESDRHSLTWCEWIEELLEGRKGPPPAVPLPDDLFEVVAALVDSGVSEPTLVRLVRERRRVGEVVVRSAEAISERLKELAEGRRKEVGEEVRDILRSVVDSARAMRVPEERLAAEVASVVEELMRSRYKVPVEPGELVRAAVEGLKGGVERASESMVSVLERRVKPPSPAGTAKDVRGLGQEEREVPEEDLVKRPKLRLGRTGEPGTAAALLLLLVVALSLASSLTASTVLEFAVVRVLVPPQLVGSALVHFIPFNATRHVSERGVYVLAEVPSFYHVFSVIPPLVLVFEPSVPPEVTYRVYSSVENPYSQFSVPYTSNVFAAYDDFDYPSDMWRTVNATISGGKATIRSGWMVLDASLPDTMAVLLSFSGGRGLRLVFPSPGLYAFALTDANFTDWSFVRDGSDVFFVDDRGSPVYYGLLYFSREHRVLVAVVHATTQVVYMAYGGVNRYPEYRVLG